MLAAGEQRVDSGVAAIVIATAPLIVAVLALRFEPAERVTGRRLAGLLIGPAGVAALVGLHLGGGSEELLGFGAVFVAACGYAVGPTILALDRRPPAARADTPPARRAPPLERATRAGLGPP